eukprot:PhM_4_TR10023/c1_g1_i1/m.95040
MSSDEATRAARKRTSVQWDETNLQANEAYFKEHPVTMHIDEGKTPYAEMPAGFMQNIEEKDAENTWKTDVNAVARDTKYDAVHGGLDRPSATNDDHHDNNDNNNNVNKSGKPHIRIADCEQQPHSSSDMTPEEQERVFKAMRSKVLGDEAAKFRELMKKGPPVDDDDEDENEEGGGCGDEEKK